MFNQHTPDTGNIAMNKRVQVSVLMEPTVKWTVGRSKLAEEQIRLSQMRVQKDYCKLDGPGTASLKR